MKGEVLTPQPTVIQQPDAVGVRVETTFPLALGLRVIPIDAGFWGCGR